MSSVLVYCPLCCSGAFVNWRRDASLKGFTLGDREPALLDLRFADEILLFAKSYAETVSLLHDLVTAFLACRLDSTHFSLHQAAIYLNFWMCASAGVLIWEKNVSRA